MSLVALSASGGDLEAVTCVTEVASFSEEHATTTPSDPEKAIALRIRKPHGPGSVVDDSPSVPYNRLHDSG